MPRQIKPLRTQNVEAELSHQILGFGPPCRSTGELIVANDLDPGSQEMLVLLVERLTSRKNRVTWTDETILGMHAQERERGIIIGVIEQP